MERERNSDGDRNLDQGSFPRVVLSSGPTPDSLRDLHRVTALERTLPVPSRSRSLLPLGPVSVNVSHVPGVGGEGGVVPDDLQHTTLTGFSVSTSLRNTAASIEWRGGGTVGPLHPLYPRHTPSDPSSNTNGSGSGSGRDPKPEGEGLRLAYLERLCATLRDREEEHKAEQASLKKRHAEETHNLQVALEGEREGLKQKQQQYERMRGLYKDMVAKKTAAEAGREGIRVQLQAEKDSVKGRMADMYTQFGKVLAGEAPPEMPLQGELDKRDVLIAERDAQIAELKGQLRGAGIDIARLQKEGERLKDRNRRLDLKLRETMDRLSERAIEESGYSSDEGGSTESSVGGEGETETEREREGSEDSEWPGSVHKRAAHTPPFKQVSTPVPSPKRRGSYMGDPGVGGVSAVLQGFAESVTSMPQFGSPAVCAPLATPTRHPSSVSESVSGYPLQPVPAPSTAGLGLGEASIYTPDPDSQGYTLGLGLGMGQTASLHMGAPLAMGYPALDIEPLVGTASEDREEGGEGHQVSQHGWAQ
ncbi:hypothetical protein KIPB_002100 [Kipferlia bialata]|uniref:Uncharacterized protein n=1 Tax=Kipferlia bialata TaxID=797122 RepID=A0A9K3CPN4_9EUKA|nr:hypothetical protein KIPB_000263 [Kipferlia bialata]GIQ81183.1 hypothetical protein KIPB_002100 [Kipferlia bialata]|eukprot:g263.t1